MSELPATAEAETFHPGVGLLSMAEWKVIGAQFELSSRELAVAQMLFEGGTRDSIAFQLRKADGSSLSPETVRVYRERLFRKMRVEDVVGMTLRIVRSAERFEWSVQESNTNKPPP